MTLLQLRKKRQLFCLNAIALCLFIWLILTPPAIAQSPPDPAFVDSLRQRQEQIDQQRFEIEKERDRLSKNEQAVQAQLNAILYSIHSTDIAYKDYDYQIQLANKHIKELEEDLAIAQQTYSQKQAATIARLRFLQRQQHSGLGWDVLLKSQNLNEFLNRRRRVKLIYQADRQILAQLQTEGDRIQQQQAEIEQQKNQISLLQQQLLTKRQEYEAQLAAQQDLIKRLNSNKQALEAAQAQLEADSEGIALLIQQEMQKARFPRNGVFGTGQLISPSDGAITSGFGWRHHPILGTSRLHAGIDFGASYGSTIRAADSGVVIFAGWYGGYGYTLVIDHGDGIATLYGHTSKLHVSTGQSVQQGEAIAAVGSTGLSTGAHLHFEVRKNGEPVDPILYL